MPESSPPADSSGTGSGQAEVVNYGTISGPVAAGAHARVTQHVHAATDAGDLLARLELALGQLIEAAAGELGSQQAQQVADDGDRIAEEIRRSRPDHGRITQLLGRITGLVGSAAGLLDAVDRVRALVEALLH